MLKKPLKGPGVQFPKSVTMEDLYEMFPADAAAEAWFIRVRWSTGIACPACDSHDVFRRKSRNSPSFRCRTCAKVFSVKTDTVMHKSKLSLRKCAFAIYQLMTLLKEVTSMKLSRDLGITQRSAWYMSHRIRLAMSAVLPFGGLIQGPVEVD